MSRPWPWFKFYPAEYQSQTRGMKASEKGVYVDLLAIMHERSEPIPDEIRTLARATGTTTAAFRSALETLITRGAIFRTKDGRLWSEASQREKEIQEKHSELAREKSSKRWENNEENQRKDDAAALRYKTQDKDRDSDGPSDHQESSTSHASKDTNSKTGDRSAREGAASFDVNIEDEINLPEIGFGWVEKIISRRPLVTAVIVRDDEGCSTAYRVEHLHDEKLTWTEISLDDVDALPDRPDEREGTHDAA